MSNFALRPIDIEIRKKLLQKQKAFSRKSTGGATAGSTVTDPEMVQFFNRTTWAHLISLSVIKSADDEKHRLAIIGAGELNQEPGGVANQPLMRSSFEGIYGQSSLLKPISGIKSISTKYEGTLRSRRDATVQFTVFSLEDLERLSPHFLRVGGEVLLEFGWNSEKTGLSYDFSSTLGSQIITAYHNEGVSSIRNISSIEQLKTNSAENYEKAVLDLKGDYEYVLGTVKNFDYSLRSDGGFDCTIVITTIGMSLLDSKVNREESPSQILQHELHVEDEKVPDLPHTNFYHVIDNLPEILTYSIIDNFVSNNSETETTTSEQPEKVSAKPKLSREELIIPENVKQFIVNRQSDIEEMLSVVDGGQYTPQVVDETWGTKNKGIYEFTNSKFEGGKVVDDLDGYFNSVESYWIGIVPQIRYRGGIIEVLKYSSKRKKEIFFEIGYTAVPSQYGAASLEMDITDYGPIDFRLAAETLLKMRTGEIPGYENTSMTDWNPILVTSASPINLSSEPLPEPILIFPDDPDLNGDSNVFQDVIGGPDEDDTKVAEPMTRGEWYHEKISSKSKSGDKEIEEGETIFVAYIQGNTIQALTGFIWDPETDFIEPAKSFCEKMFTGNSLDVAGKERMSKGFFDATKMVATGRLLWGDKTENIPSWGTKGKVIYDEDKLTEDQLKQEELADQFLEGFMEGTLPKTWVRWGWFEDNIISKYLGFENLDTEADESNISPIGKPISIFKSVEPKVDRADSEDGKIIPDKYESNKIALPGDLKTTNVNEIIIPDRCDTLDMLGKMAGVIGQKKYNAKLYGTLGKVLMDGFGNATIAPVEKSEGNEGSTPETKVGYIRNLLVEVTVLREAFLNIGSLREGMENFFHVMRRNFGPIHDFEIQPGRDEGMVGIVDNNLLYELGIFKRPEINFDDVNDIATKMRVYEFPAWEKESIVKSQDLKVTIPNSMAVVALYAGNENKSKQFDYDKGLGSLKVQKLAKFLKLDETGKDPRESSLGNKSKLRPLYDSKNLVNSGTGDTEEGMIKYKFSGDFYKKLSSVYKSIISTTGVDEPALKSYEAGENKKVDNSRKTINVWDLNKGVSWYNITGELGNPLSIPGDSLSINYRRQMEYELEYDARTQVQQNFNALNGLMSLGLTIDGTAGLFPGNSYISKYLPKAFEKRTEGIAKDEYPLLFQATNIEHEVSPSGWNTTITGMPRLNNKAFPSYLVREEISDKDDVSIPEKSDSEITDGLSRFLNFFNLNYDFAKTSIENISGINPVVGVDDKGGAITPLSKRLFKDNSDFGITKVEWSKESLVSKLESIKPVNPGYADYTNHYNQLLNDYTAINYKGADPPNIVGVRFIQGKDGAYEFAKPGSNMNIHGPDEIKYNSLQMALFLQISSVIAGISYNSMKEGLPGGKWRFPAPNTVSRVWYSQALADMVDWPSSRPSDLVGTNSYMKQIGMKINESDQVQNIQAASLMEREHIYAYFGIDYEPKRTWTAGGNVEFDTGHLHTKAFSWSKEMWGESGPGNGDSYRAKDLAIALVTETFGSNDDFQYNNRSMMSRDNANVISQNDEDPITENQVDDKYTLIGPIYSGIPSGYFSFSEDYAEFTTAFWNLMFAVILKNELGIPERGSPIINGAPNWEALDAKLLELHKNSIKGDAIKQVDVGEIQNIKSRKIFEHALQCQYLIAKP